MELSVVYVSSSYCETTNNLPYRVMSSVCRTGSCPSSARLLRAAMKPTILSLLCCVCSQHICTHSTDCIQCISISTRVQQATSLSEGCCYM
jgi:hypothetical protein